ncbi:hypothetical protein [Aromatoleum evansii]|uniref:hypothetical protein n=1 Tax=Aromatoleum evansii TaxID=59406 RepID=UPI00145D38A3|nr:hypothetical protein [Aromatoleum evansii]NMG31099.1 hypothetical protein [Aromatoleum evansii]
MAFNDTFTTPDGKTSIARGSVGRMQVFPNGVAIYDLRGRMIAWIPIGNETVGVLVVEMLTGFINTRGRSKIDWSMLELAEDSDRRAA